MFLTELIESCAQLLIKISHEQVLSSSHSLTRHNEYTRAARSYSTGNSRQPEIIFSVSVGFIMPGRAGNYD